MYTSFIFVQSFSLTFSWGKKKKSTKEMSPTSVFDYHVFCEKGSLTIIEGSLRTVFRPRVRCVDLFHVSTNLIMSESQVW